MPIEPASLLTYPDVVLQSIVDLALISVIGSTLHFFQLAALVIQITEEIGDALGPD